VALLSFLLGIPKITIPLIPKSKISETTSTIFESGIRCISGIEGIFLGFFNPSSTNKG
jgi:hypothetical protein